MGEARRLSRVRYAAPEMRRALDNLLASPKKPAEKRERGALRNPPAGGVIAPLTICQRFSGRSWPLGTARRSTPPDVPLCLFPGRPDSFNSIFVDGSQLFPQMDVWSRCGVGRTLKESRSTTRQQPATARVLGSTVFRKILLLKARRSVFSLDKSLSWMYPFLHTALNPAMPSTDFHPVV